MHSRPQLRKGRIQLWTGVARSHAQAVVHRARLLLRVLRLFYATSYREAMENVINRVQFAHPHRAALQAAPAGPRVAPNINAAAAPHINLADGASSDDDSSSTIAPAVLDNLAHELREAGGHLDDMDVDGVDVEPAEVD